MYIKINRTGFIYIISTCWIICLANIKKHTIQISSISSIILVSLGSIKFIYFVTENMVFIYFIYKWKPYDLEFLQVLNEKMKSIIT